jgi:hypothetical protein
MKTRTAHLLLLASAVVGTASSKPASYRFADREPVREADDRKPIPPPQAADFHKTFYFVDVVVRRPAVRSLAPAPVRSSRDVNALDEMPSSSWFTPRLGARELSPEEMLRGPAAVGSPQLPIRVLKAKPQGNPGFVIADARGKKYIVKFDPPEFPGIETTTAFVVNRLFWSFGYNVPEDFTFYLRREELEVAPESQYTAADVDKVLSLVAPPVDGRYRATASLLIDGVYLGPTMDRGLREDDPNDGIPHEERRVLRALRVFGAFLNHSDMRVDNAGDFYQGEAGQGHVEHYLLDFGEAFGGHGAEHGYPWDGFEHYFSYRAAAHNFVTLGLDVHPWEHIVPTPWKSVGMFESTTFDPATWKEVYPFEPMRRSQPADDYWAAKIVARLTHEQLQALVQAADYPEPGAGDYVLQTLWERRRKVLGYFMRQVTPVDAVGVEGEMLQLVDMGRRFAALTPTAYEVRFWDGEGSELQMHSENLPAGTGDVLELPIPVSLRERAHGYLRVDLRAHWGDAAAPSPAQFHLRFDGQGEPRVVGIVH